MKRVALVLFLASVAPACSSATPSKSEAERAVKAEFADCPSLAIENFKLVNGRKVTDTVHQVEVQYDLRVIPLSAAKIQERRQLKTTRESQLQNLAQKTADLEKRDAELDAEAEAIVVQIKSELTAQGMTPDSPGYWQRYDELKEQLGLNRVNAEQRKVYSELHPTAGQRPATILADPNSLMGWGTGTCLMRSGVDFTNPRAVTEALEKGHTAAKRIAFPMVKTDKGWLPAR